jgi:hypothetical protein
MQRYVYSTSYLQSLDTVNTRRHGRNIEYNPIGDSDYDNKDHQYNSSGDGNWCRNAL